MKKWDYAPIDSSLVQSQVAALDHLPADTLPPRVSLSGPALAQWQMGALVDVELLAARAGLVPMVTLEDGSQGIVNVGAARDRLGAAPEWLKTLYLATHRRVGATMATASAATRANPRLSSSAIGFPVLWPIVALGVAALVAGAWYATEAHKTDVEVASREAIDLAKVRETVALAHRYLDEGKAIPGEIWSHLTPSAQAETALSSWKKPLPYLLLGGGLLAAFFVWRLTGARAGGPQLSASESLGLTLWRMFNERD